MMGIIFFIGGVICMLGITQLALSFIQRYEALQTVKAKIAFFGVFNIGVSFLLPILPSVLDISLPIELQELFVNISKYLLVIGILCLVSSFISLFIKTKEAV